MTIAPHFDRTMRIHAVFRLVANVERVDRIFIVFPSRELLSQLADFESENRMPNPMRTFYVEEDVRRIFGVFAAIY